MTAGRLRWGLAAAGAYLLVAGVLIASGHPVLPLFDGLVPTTYRWVDPPPGFERENQEALPGRSRVPLEEEGAITVITDDGQAQVSILTQDVVIPEGQRAVVASLTALDPATIGPPPAGQRFDSNAYEAEVLYLPSEEPLEFAEGDPAEDPPSATILLRYASHATRLVRWDESTGSWTPLQSTLLRGTLQIYAPSTELDMFAALGPITPPGEDEGWPFWLRWALYAAAGLVVVLGVEVYLRWRRKERTRVRRKRR
jgi:hypothetical protein